MYKLNDNTIIKKVERMKKTKYVTVKLDSYKKLIFSDGTEIVMHTDKYRDVISVTTDDIKLENTINNLIKICRHHNGDDVEILRENFYNLTGTFPTKGDPEEIIKSYIDFAKTYHATFNSWDALRALSETSILGEVYYKTCLAWNSGTYYCEIPASRCFYYVLKKKLTRTKWDSWSKFNRWINAIY